MFILVLETYSNPTGSGVALHHLLFQINKPGWTTNFKQTTIIWDSTGHFVKAEGTNRCYSKVEKYARWRQLFPDLSDDVRTH